jgi:hypothetical protein
MSSERPSQKQKKLVEERARGRCEYCGSPVWISSQPFNADHVIPRSKGGKTTLDNLAFSCGCNGCKGNRTHAIDPKSGRLVPLFNPRKQKWPHHFAWSADSLFIVGLTATGRATVELLQLNRTKLLNLRRMLILAGEHPPQPE